MKKLVLALCVISGGTSAQNFVADSRAASSLQISRDESGVSACGIHTVVTHDKPYDKETGRGIDFSLMVYSSMMTLIKFGVFEGSFVGGSLQRLPAQQKAFLAIPSMELNLHSEVQLPSGTVGYTIASAGAPGSVTQVIYEIARGAKVQIQIPVSGETLTNTVQFVAPLTDVERSALTECVQGLIGAAKKSTPASPQSPKVDKIKRVM